MAPIIVAKGLTKVFDGLVAVDHIDFEVEEQECFGFLGPNGAGKTSTMRMIFCNSPITAGELTIASMPCKTHSAQIKALIGVVPQENNLDPDLTVLENLIVYARYFDIPERTARARAREALDLFHLLERQTSRIDQLSGGMKRRLLVARALINEPRVLILDEPTTGLDPQARHLVWQKLRYLKARGATMVLTTHYMDEAAQLCDRLVIMDGGKILTTGGPQELVAKYAGREVMELRLAGADRKLAITKLSNLDVRLEEIDDVLYVFAKDGVNLRGLTEYLSLDLKSLVYRPATLEDVFLRLAGRGLRE
ncbi:MAG: ATP-binding cassette domain-containing protein [Chloroflexi bacterium]|nr:ATP-binding cassette domain-containing protein [Chloroflexota bacterium]